VAVAGTSGAYSSNLRRSITELGAIARSTKDLFRNLTARLYMALRGKDSTDNLTSDVTHSLGSSTSVPYLRTSISFLFFTLILAYVQNWLTG
jgi:hypothetical protein